MASTSTNIVANVVTGLVGKFLRTLQQLEKQQAKHSALPLCTSAHPWVSQMRKLIKRLVVEFGRTQHGVLQSSVSAFPMCGAKQILICWGPQPQSCHQQLTTGWLSSFDQSSTWFLTTVMGEHHRGWLFFRTGHRCHGWPAFQVVDLATHTVHPNRLSRYAFGWAIMALRLL